jgi:hypothetical protein
VSTADREWAQRLDLDPESVPRIGRHALGWAAALAESDVARRRGGEVRALYRLAASCQLLEDPTDGSTLMDAAGRLADLGDTYSYVLAVCARDSEAVSPAVFAPDRRATPTEDAHVLIALASAAVASDDEGIRERYETQSRTTSDHRGVWLGQLLAPASTVSSMLDSVVLNQPRDAIEGFAWLLRSVSETTAAAMTDRYHWQRMMTRVMPVDPEIVALLVVALTAQGSTDGLWPDEWMLEMPAEVALEIATSIVEGER